MYCYETEKQKIFTEEGQVEFLTVRDTVKELLKNSGAFSMCKAWARISGDSWKMMAYVDRLVELKEIREVTPPGVAGQDRIFVGAR